MAPEKDDGSTLGASEHWHNYQPWLYEERRDKYGRLSDHPDFDPTTLKVPTDDKMKYFKRGKAVTPAMKQWWLIKADHFDCILFFKVGKFYELFHMDADVGVQVLQTNGIPFIFMRGLKAHAGFPEISYGKFSSILVDKGYKVARVEQVQKASDAKKAGSKVVGREIVAIITPGTRTHTYLDPNVNDFSPEPSYLFTVTERAIAAAPASTESSSSAETNNMVGLAPVCEYGVCYVDSTTGSFKVGCFQDGPQRNRLRTLMAKLRPKEIVYPHALDGPAQQLSDATLSILRAESHPDAVLTPQGKLVSRKTKKRLAWDPSATVSFFDTVYQQIDDINAEEETRESTVKSSRQIWPWVMKQMLVVSPSQGGDDTLTPNEACALAWSAVGGLVAHLEKCLIAFQLLDQGTFDAYVPGDMEHGSSRVSRSNEAIDEEGAMDDDSCDMEGASETTNTVAKLPNFMNLDQHAIRNLEIFENSYDRGREGTLFEFLDHTKTAMGRRLYHNWLSSPLCRPSTINKRLDAVEDLIQLSSERQSLRRMLSKIPDLERLESSIHTLGSRYLSKDHPMASAVMYEEVSYMKKKYGDYWKALEGFEGCQRLMESFKEDIGSYQLTSNQLEQLLNMDNVDMLKEGESSNMSSQMRWPNLTPLLQKLRKIAPPKPTKADLSINMDGCTDPKYNALRAEERAVNDSLVQFLRQAKREHHAIKYFGKGKNAWQVEVADKQKVPSSWAYNSKKKGFKRYYPKEVLRWKEQLEQTTEGIEECQADRLRVLFRTFSRHHRTWKTALRCIARLDALVSLSMASEEIRQGADGELFCLVA